VDSTILKLKAIFEHLGSSLDIGRFTNRLLIQKTVYFVQEVGIDLGFRYSWYRYGPYCRHLSEAAYKHHDNQDFFNKRAQHFTVTETGSTMLGKVQQLTDNTPDDMDKPAWLELLASIHFLTHHAFIPGDRVTEENISDWLLKYDKDYFDNEQIQQGWECLEKAGLMHD